MYITIRCARKRQQTVPSDPDAGDVVEEVVVVDTDSESDEETTAKETKKEATEEEDEDDNEIDNENIYIPREIDWNDPVDDEEDDEQRNIQRNENENETETDVERGEEEIQDFITAPTYPVLNSNIHRNYDASNNNNITVRNFPGLIGEPPRIST